MNKMPDRRDIGPFLQRVRAFLLGREHTTAHRHQFNLSPRTQPPPDIPSGTAKLWTNYYFMRDARCQVRPPIDLVQQKKDQEAAEAAKMKAAEAAKAKGPEAGKAKGTESAKTEEKKPCADSISNKGKCKSGKLPTPGKLHFWD
ncbi:NADH dehydrogenase [ubiquinone] 1 alpha subcomplex subunit 7 [Scaptodrosophila lebanonensis]|uniref:NADH dehydrogenase [ubiquinone] 1 alpha subcomplex subunit 7 n=1 Tax=Drosophila lebanonensis TaxID=7225 RepID=A0A6J2UCD3_DROLE|nr:NADH dehydrogenase [ubiquinone] 1 alpha subcomplex subunit 7 [Scaptodrosophila lebanonensis]